jgi:hypothetical protein
VRRPPATLAVLSGLLAIYLIAAFPRRLGTHRHLQLALSGSSGPELRNRLLGQLSLTWGRRCVLRSSYRCLLVPSIVLLAHLMGGHGAKACDAHNRNCSEAMSHRSYARRLLEMISGTTELHLISMTAGSHRITSARGHEAKLSHRRIWSAVPWTASIDCRRRRVLSRARAATHR